MAYSLAQTHKLKFITINIVYLLCCYTETAQSKTVIPQCKSKNYFEKYSDINLAKCKQDRSSSVCKKLENSIKQNGIDPETKLKQCDINGAKKEFAFEYIPFVSTVSCLNGLANFGISSVANIGRMIGEFAGAIKVDFDKSKERSDQCNSSVDNKIALYKAFNISTPKLMNINIPSKDSINNKQCWQIENDLREHGRLQQKKLEFSLNPRGLKGQFDQMTADEKNFWQWSHPEISNGSGHTDLLKTAKEILVQKGLELDCYSSYTAQALVCEAMTEAATLLLGFQSGIKRLSQASKIPEIAGVSKEINMIKKISPAEIKSPNLKNFGKKYGLATEPIILDGETYMRIIPNPDGNWLERMAAVYKRKYGTDFLVQDHMRNVTESGAKLIEKSSDTEKYRAVILNSDIDLNDKANSMVYIAHELVHAREIAATNGVLSNGADTAIYFLSSEGNIPLSGYNQIAMTNEVNAYKKSIDVLRSQLAKAESSGDKFQVRELKADIEKYAEMAKSHQKFYDQELTDIRSFVADKNNKIQPVKEHGYVRISISTTDSKGHEIPVVFEFPPNTSTNPDTFKIILLDRIQREIDKNRKIVQGL